MKDEKNNIVNCAYVIDKEYRITHYNLAIKEIYPDLEIGDICYRKLQMEDVPCKVCPLKTPKKEGLLYYNKYKKAWVDCMAAPLDLITGEEDHVVICHTITEMREDQREQALRLLAEEGKERDSLTELYNREIFFMKAEAMMMAARPSEYCMIALDVENFKLYNTLYGFPQGNDFLHYIGYTMKEVLKHVGFAGYIGEDDFAAFLPNREDLVTDIEERLKYYIDSRGESSGFYPAIGIYVIDDIDASIEEIYDRASTARTLLRGNHMSRMIWYDESMLRGMEENYNMLNDLKRGLEHDEFVVYLQPKCNMRDKSIVGMEALCRWQHPDKGLLSPGAFIHQLEANGLITSLDYIIWEKVCIMLKDWQNTGKKIVPVSVNVSRIDFFELNVVRALQELIEKYDIPKEYLEVEVTESAYAEDEMIVKRAIDRLREYGITVSMDDFGSGYSSLNMLQNVSVDILKLDMRFLQLEYSSESRGVHILEMIIQLAKSLNIKVIAEGVESERHRELLLQMGCEYAQGYFYFRPMSVKEAEELLKNSATVSRIENPVSKELGFAAAKGLDQEKLIAQLCDLSGKYRSVRRKIKVFEAAMQDYFDEKMELDYSKGDYGEQIKNAIVFLSRNWKLQYEAKEKIRKLLNPEENEIRREGSIVNKLKVKTEDNQELLLFALFIDSNKVLLCIRNQGKIPVEKIMMSHPFLKSYDYDVERDILQVKKRSGPGEIKTVVIDDFKKNMSGQNHLSRDSIVKLKKELTRALKLPTYGVIEYESEESRGNKQWDRLYFQSLANQRGKIYRVAAISGNIEGEDKDAKSWKEMANRDQMTGFLNHDTALFYMEVALEDAGGGTLISLDIDNFKQINDSVGHIQGDECIRKLSTLLRDTFRETDLFGRMGGDEFLIFMPGVVQPEIFNYRVQEFFSKLEMIKIPRVGVLKCSIGVASTCGQAMNLSSLLKQADYALYEAKNAGKGHFVSIEDGKTVHHGIEKQSLSVMTEKQDHEKECELIGKLFLMLYSSKSKSEGINKALAYLGEKLDVSRVYVFSIEDNVKYARNTYEWCAEGIESEIDHLQKVEFENLGFSLDNYYENDMWFCPDVSMIRESGMRKLLESQNIKGMLHWIFRKDGCIVGVIGFDECRDNVNWSTQYAAVLRHAGAVLSTYILYNN